MQALAAILATVGFAVQQTPLASRPMQIMSSVAPVAQGDKQLQPEAASAPETDWVSSAQQSLPPACDQDGWFNPVPKPFLPDCVGVLRAPACLPLSPADVDGDGREEVFTANNGLLYQNNAVTSPFPLLTSHEISRSEAGVSARTRDVLQSSTVANWSAPMVGGTDWFVAPPEGYSGDCRGERWLVDVRVLGWLDCDDDGDLDLIAQVYVWKEVLCWYCSGCQFCWPCTWTTNYPSNVAAAFAQAPIWFENLRPPSRVADADLNGDGVVDGADLGVLLNSWGNT